jgi:CheY-like chemotaxis protein
MKILYVENHDVFAAQVSQQFLFGHSIQIVASLVAAKAALAAAPYDLLIVDYDLDDGKGDELVRASLSLRPGLKIIAASSHDAGNAALLKAGAYAVCGKLEFNRIQQVIDSLSSLPHLLWWVVPGVLAGMPMPFIHPERRMNQGGALTSYDDELPLLYAAGVRAVVSLLNVPSDAAVYESAGFAFHCLPVPDGGAPTIEQAQEFVGFINQQRGQSHPVAVHCEAGLGRTGTMLAVYLISEGDSAASAINSIGAKEKSAIETQRQIEFLEQYAHTIQFSKNQRFS